MAKGFTFKIKETSLADHPLDELELSNRAMNVLKRAHIFTISALVESWNSLSRIRGSGQTTVEEIHSKFFMWYLVMIAGTPEWSKFIDSLEVTS